MTSWPTVSNEQNLENFWYFVVSLQVKPNTRNLNRYKNSTRLTGIFLFILLLSSVVATAQRHLGVPTVQDCAGAIPVCQPVYNTINSYTGHGNIYPEIRANGVCPLCMDGEKNDVFYIITVQTDGLLRFKLTPNNATNDYDWELFNMTNAECSEIYSKASQLTVSCNSYGITGNNGPTGISTMLGNNSNCNGPGNLNGPAFNKDLIVHAGETYILNVSNWSSTAQSGYTLDFGMSTAVIFDNVPPVVDSIQNIIECAGATELYVRFSENVKCSDVYQHPEKFTITGSGGPYTITGITSPTCATGANQSPSYTFSITPALFAGSYELNILGDVHDLCNNLAVYGANSFQLQEINAPSASAGNDTSVANGAIIPLHGLAGGGTGPYTYHWEPANLLLNPNVQVPTTINLGASVLFTLTVTDSKGCHGHDDVLVTVVGGPLGVSAAADPATICNGGYTVLHALASGGSGNYTYSWTSNPPGFTSNIQDPTVYPTTNTSYSVQLADGFSTASGSTTVHVNQKPVAYPGSNTTIPFGTNASLSCYATGGSGNYSFYWSSNPAGYSSTLQAPTFVNLTVTTIFTLVITDVITGCVGEPAQVIYTVTGGPLNTNPIANPSVICQGVTTQLFCMAGGGSGNYTYTWTSTPGGYSSSQPNPFVSPVETTNYHLTLFDGFNQTTGTVNVVVNEVPVIHLGPLDTTVCVYDTIVLDAGNEGSDYYWSNGATTRTIRVGTSGIGYDFQTYKVKVTSPNGCQDSAEIHISFSFAACTGLRESLDGSEFSLFPNPVHETLKIKGDCKNLDPVVVIYDLVGKEVLSTKPVNQKEDLAERDYDMSALPSGIYFIQLSTMKSSRMYKIIIQ